MKLLKNIIAPIILSFIFFCSVSNSSFLNNLKDLEKELNLNDWSCSLNKTSAIKEFKNKVLTNPYPNFLINPYKNQTFDLLSEINSTLNNKTIVCAIKYEKENRTSYKIEDFPSKESAEEKGYMVTHQGKCAACSNLNDLAVYLSGGLTAPVRKCGFLTIISNKLALKCLRNIGFTAACAQIWLFNSINTKENCFTTCMISWIKNEPFADKDGKLNECINCDENISGPVFKFFSGRTRRNSGIESEINRPDEQIYKMDHCYY